MKEETTFFKDYQNLINSFEALKKSADNPFFKSKYVPLKEILPIVKENCHKNNFILIQVPLMIDGISCLGMTIRHSSGEEITGDVELVHKPEDPQKMGASITYMRRYMLTCMFGLEEEDDDGNTASEKKVSPVRNTEDLGVCSTCGAELKRSAKGDLYCPDTWKSPKHKSSGPNESEQAFMDSLPE